MRAAIFALPMFSIACGGSSNAASYADSGAWYQTSTAFDASAPSSTGSTDGAPEVEEDFLALRPAQTDQYVFVANPSRNTVTRINLLDQQVRTLEVGIDPQLVLTTPDYRSAAVFNRGDNTVSLIEASSLTQQFVSIRPHMNSMTASHDAKWLALWHDADAERPDDPIPPGTQSFNEASFVNTLTGEHFAMAVGFNPREISFTSDSSLALVLADTSLAIVDMGQEQLLPEMIVISDALEPPEAEELAIADNGSFAFLRQFGATELIVVDLPGRGLDTVAVGENPTDLDVSPDGSTAVALSRGANQLWIYQVADPFAPARVIDLPVDPPGGFGQLVFDPRGDQAILFTNASLTDLIGIWDLETDTVQLRRLAKPVQSMSITPTGESMLVFHTLDDADDADPFSPFSGEWAITMLDLTDYRTNPLLLPAEPIGWAQSTNGDYGYFVMDGQNYLEVLHYDTLLYDQIALPSPPVWVGVLPDLDLADGNEPPAWVSQEHELGRLTFFDADDGSTETITGFELNAEIE